MLPRSLHGPGLALALVSATILLGPLALRAGEIDPETYAPHYVHEVFGQDDGLPKAGFARVVQTPDGYLWIATFGGLVRYDGHRFLTLDLDSTPVLGGSRIGYLEVDDQGDLWVVAESGHLAVRRQGRFTGCPLPGRGATLDCDLPVEGSSAFRAVFSSSQGGAWATSSSQGLFRLENGQVTSIDAMPEETRVRSVQEDHDGFLWVVTESGVWIRSGERFVRVRSEVLQNLTYFDAIVARAGDGTIWISDRSYDPDQDAFLRRAALGEDGRVQLFESVIQMAGGNHGPWISPAPGGELWGTTLDQLFLYRDGEWNQVASDPEEWFSVPLPVHVARDPAGRSYVLWRNRLIRHEGALDFPLVDAEQDALSSIWISDDGTIWLTSSRGTLHALYPTRAETLGEGLEHPSIYSTFETPDGDTWVGGGSPAYLPAGARRFRSYPCPGGFHLCMVRDYVEDRQGRLWIGFEDQFGLVRFGADGTYIEATLPEGRSEPLAILALAPAAEGTFWVGSDEGLFRYDPARDRWQTYPLDGPEEPAVRAIHPRADGSLWLGTRGRGLFHWSPEGTRRLHPGNGFPSNMIRSIWEDPQGHLWVSTETAGLVRLDPESITDPGGPKVARLGKDQGLLLNAIHHVVPDHLGDLWVSSNEGILRGRFEDFRAVAEGRLDRAPITVYDEQSGMGSREANGGNHAAGAQDREGRMIFPTQSGLVRFDPELDWPSQPLPRAFIDGLNVGQSRRATPGGTVALDSTERSFSIDYSAPFPRAAEHLRFKVRLVPYDSDWIDVGSRRTAFYTRVPPGEYRFEVTVAHQGLPHRGEWHPEPAALVLELRPRFFETRWFAGLCLLLAIALAIGGVRLRLARLRQRARELERTVARRTAIISEQAEKLRELDQVKSDLFANVSHELRTPLTLIIGSIRDALEQSEALQPNSRAREYLDVGARNAHRLLGLVDQLLDVAKVDSGGLVLRTRVGKVDELLRLAVERAVPMAERERVTLEAAYPSEPVEAEFDGPQLEKVFDNLITNALKFVPEGGLVQVGLETASAQTYEVRVRDDGPGIPESELGRVFERFHQAGHESRYTGSGLGLTLARQITELHGGTLTVESTVGKGSTFLVQLPRFEGAVQDPASRAAESESAPMPRPRPPLPPRPEHGFSADHAPPDYDPPEDAEGAEDAEADRATVLVVDDNADLRAYLRRHLVAQYRVLAAADGRQALDLAREQKPDVVVSDIMMPELDGRELFRHLRQDPELELIPVILVTAMASEDSRLRGLREGVDEYLVKPFDPRELRARIANMLRSRRRLLDRLAPPTPTPAAALAPGVVDLPSADRSFLDRVRAVIEEHLDDPDFTVEQLASEMHCDRSHLLRRLRALVNESPSSLIRSMRLGRAEQLLRVDAARVNEIAYSVGFKSLSHFSNSFTKEYGERPSAFAARHRSVDENPVRGANF